MVHSSASPGASSSKVQLCFECKFTANSTARRSGGWRTTYVCSSGQNLYPLNLRVQEPRWDPWGCGSWRYFLSSFQRGLHSNRGMGDSGSPSGQLWPRGCLQLPPGIALLRSSHFVEWQPCGLVAHPSFAKSCLLDHSLLAPLLLTIPLVLGPWCPLREAESRSHPPWTAKADVRSNWEHQQGAEAVAGQAVQSHLTALVFPLFLSVLI